MKKALDWLKGLSKVDNLDVDMINKCKKRMLKGNNYINQSTKIIEEM